MRTVSALAVLAAVAALSPIGDASAQRSVTAVPPAEYRSSAVAPKAETAMVAAAAPVHRIVLAAPSEAERGKLKEAAPAKLVGRPRPGKHRPLAVGFPRELPVGSREIVLSDLAWQTMADGSRVARVSVNSPGAAALRLSMSLPAAHPDLVLRFAGNGPRATTLGPYPANAIAEAARRHGRFLTPVLEGDTATIELHAGAGASFGGLTLTFGPASHLVVAGDTLQRVDPKRESDIGDAGACNLDIACVTASPALTQAANSVGKVLFNERSGLTYLCTGTMLNDSTTSFTPYLFAASHCIDDAFKASTINVYWFFRAQACGSKAVPAYALQTGGAMLLARSDDFDWALVRLHGAPPNGVQFSAWRAEPVPQLAIVTSLHHAAGDLAKFSQGSSPGYQVFSDGSSFIEAQWSQGTTETGSSGAGLFTFLASAGYYELRGGLFGGDASCGNAAGLDYYSRLDNMLPVTRQYLTPDAGNPADQAVAVEFYNRSLDHYFITIDANEINLLDTGVLRGWERTGVRFLAYATQAAGTNPVCRFYRRPPEDSHFYSGSPQECTDTLARFGASWIYESPNVFYIAIPDQTTGACPGGTRPIWRFFNTRTTNHRYTPEVTLRDQLRSDPDWLAEGYGPDLVIMCSPVSN